MTDRERVDALLDEVARLQAQNRSLALEALHLRTAIADHLTAIGAVTLGQPR